MVLLLVARNPAPFTSVAKLAGYKLQGASIASPYLTVGASPAPRRRPARFQHHSSIPECNVLAGRGSVPRPIYVPELAKVDT